MRRFSPSRESFEFIFIVILVGVLTRVFLVTPFEATSVAMAPQVLPGDFLLATRVTFGLPLPFSSAKVGGRSPRRGEVVVFKSPESENLRYMNRVVGLPGDRVEMKDNILMINGISGAYSLPSEPVPMAENLRQIEQFPWWRAEIFVPAGTLQSFGPVVVPPGHIFVLGDYRSRSYDSRYWGFVPLKHLEAKVRWIFWSVEGPKSFRTVPKIRWERIFSTID